MSNAKDRLVLPFNFVYVDSMQRNHLINSTPKGVWCVVTFESLENPDIQEVSCHSCNVCGRIYARVLSELAGVCRGTPVETQNSSAHIVPFCRPSFNFS